MSKMWVFSVAVGPKWYWWGVLQPSNMFAVLCLKPRKGEQFEVKFQ